jgi:hypothetical protein
MTRTPSSVIPEVGDGANLDEAVCIGVAACAKPGGDKREDKMICRGERSASKVRGH